MAVHRCCWFYDPFFNAVFIGTVWSCLGPNENSSCIRWNVAETSTNHFLFLSSIRQWRMVPELLHLLRRASTDSALGSPCIPVNILVLKLVVNDICLFKLLSVVESDKITFDSSRIVSIIKRTQLIEPKQSLVVEAVQPLINYLLLLHEFFSFQTN